MGLVCGQPFGKAPTLVGRDGAGFNPDQPGGCRLRNAVGFYCAHRVGHGSATTTALSRRRLNRIPIQWRRVTVAEHPCGFGICVTACRVESDKSRPP